MKKVIALVLAVLMAFSCFAVSVSAEEPATPAVPNWGLGTSATMDQIIAKVKAQNVGETGKLVILVFDFNGYQVDIADVAVDGNWIVIDGNFLPGYYALFGNSFYAGNEINLPTISGLPQGKSGCWHVLPTTKATGVSIGDEFSGGSTYKIPSAATTGEYIVFRAVEKNIETTSPIAKVFSVFAKIIEVLFGGNSSEIYKGFVNLLAQFGIEIEDDLSKI